MRLNIVSKIAVLSCLLLVVVACTGTKTTIDEQTEKLPKVKENMLIAKLDSLSKQRPEHFFSKISAKYADKNQKVAFKASVRMRADSALQAIITFAHIPIYNSMVTPDSLIIVDKRNNCYIKETMGYLKSTFDIDFDHVNIEEFILGLPIGWDSNEEYYQIKDPYNYIISSHNKRKLRKSDKDMSGAVYIRYYLNETTSHLKRIIIDSPSDSSTVMIDYAEHELNDGFNVPSQTDLKIETPRDTLNISVKYTKMTINDPRVLYLSIPDKYERCD